MNNKFSKEPKHCINKPLQLNSVSKSENTAYNILVQGIDKTVKFVPKEEINFQNILNNGAENGATATVAGGYAGILTGFSPYEKSIGFITHNEDYLKSAELNLSNGSFSIGARATNNSCQLNYNYGTLEIQLIHENFMSRIEFQRPMSHSTFTFPSRAEAGSYTVAMTSDLAIDNPTSTSLSPNTLNSKYPYAVNGFRVHCPSISTGALIYEKMSTGWLEISASIVYDPQ
ncbi:hypothetical protein CFS9_03590 [Flavobacterium sp. CFS9]|uniref:Uncharacterized protein n=1 Tax=Flavobacterium sp. CFS9 TaxID=3143118 RepID=A0AAT9GWX6_9FLAO